MFRRLAQPGGTLGALSLTSALILGVVGIAGVVSLCIAAAVGSDFWSSNPSAQLVSAIMFGFVADGAVGFLIMDRRPWLGVILAVFGSVIFMFLLLFLVIPLILGPVMAITATIRAKALSEQDSYPSDQVPSA